MSGRFRVVRQITRADAFRVEGLLRHHLATTLSAALSLAIPGAGTAEGDGASVVVGPLNRGSSGLRVALEWDVRVWPEGRSRFTGELRVASEGDGARLELAGHAQGSVHAADDAALERILGWLALAADAGTSPLGN